METTEKELVKDGKEGRQIYGMEKKRRKTKRSKNNVPGWSGAPDQTIIKNKRLDKVSRNASE